LSLLNALLVHWGDSGIIRYRAPVTDNTALLYIPGLEIMSKKQKEICNPKNLEKNSDVNSFGKSDTRVVET